MTLTPSPESTVQGDFYLRTNPVAMWWKLHGGGGMLLLQMSEVTVFMGTVDTVNAPVPMITASKSALSLKPPYPCTEQATVEEEEEGEEEEDKIG